MTDGAIFRVTIFAIAMPTTFILEIIELVCSWTWGVMRHFIILNYVDCFARNGVLLRHSSVKLVLILNH